MKDLKEMFYSTKLAVSILILGFIISALIFAIFNLSVLGKSVISLYVLINTALSIRWLMKIHTYDYERKQKTQSEALRQAMAANAGIAGFGKG